MEPGWPSGLRRRAAVVAETRSFAGSNPAPGFISRLVSLIPLYVTDVSETLYNKHAPALYGDVVRVITFKLDEETLLKLDKVASSLGLSRSEIIRLAIGEYLNRRYDAGHKVRKVLLT